MFTREDARYRDVEMRLGGVDYRGRSVGSQVTNHQFPGVDVCFDIGQASLSSTTIGNVFVTHGHDDHVGGLGTHHLRRSGWGLEPATYYVQEDDAPLVRRMVEAQCDLNRSRALRDIKIVAVGEGSEVPVKGGLVVRPFRATHRIPCLGYALWGKRKRLRAEFQDLSARDLNRLKTKPEFRDASQEDITRAKLKPEYRHLLKPGGVLSGPIGKLMHEGVEVFIPNFSTRADADLSEEVWVPEVAFPGDTNLSILEREASDVVSKARVLLLECTFFDDEVSPKETFRTGHVHLDDFIAAARDGAFQNEVILLTHFSTRYSPDEIRRVVGGRLKDEEIGQRVRLLLPESR